MSVERRLKTLTSTNQLSGRVYMSLTHFKVSMHKFWKTKNMKHCLFCSGLRRKKTVWLESNNRMSADQYWNWICKAECYCEVCETGLIRILTKVYSHDVSEKKIKPFRVCFKGRLHFTVSKGKKHWWWFGGKKLQIHWYIVNFSIVWVTPHHQQQPVIGVLSGLSVWADVILTPLSFLFRAMLSLSAHLLASLIWVQQQPAAGWVSVK